ncbi:MAG: type IV pilin [Salinigranum sp.]
MNIKRFLSETKAVSPVIGVILMVAITVILAAVIGTFVLGLGDQVSQSQPNANIGFAYSRPSGIDQVTITHKGGDKLDGNNLKVTAGGNTVVDNLTAIGTGANGEYNITTNNWGDKSITAGDQLVFNDGSGTVDTGISNGDKVRVIWSADNGDTAIIAEGTVQ